MAGKKHSENTIKKMSVAKQGKNHPMFNKGRIERVGSPLTPPGLVKLEVKDILTNEIKIYESISEAAKALDIRQSAISLYLKGNQKSTYKVWVPHPPPRGGVPKPLPPYSITM